MNNAPQMPKKAKKVDASIQVTIRLDPNVIDALEDLVDYQTATSGMPSTRVSVMREALMRGLAELRREKRKADER